MTIEQWNLLVNIVQAVSWPIAATIIVFAMRPFLRGFLSDSKVKVAIFWDFDRNDLARITKCYE